jgi:hypothetical protein
MGSCKRLVTGANTMKTKTIYRSMFVSIGQTGYSIDFARHTNMNTVRKFYMIDPKNLSDLSLRRLDQLTYSAKKTTTAHFVNFIVVTSTFDLRIISQ